MIPRINVAECRAKNRTEGKLEFSFEGDPALIDIPFVFFASPVSVSLDYAIGEDGCVDVSCELSFLLGGSCSRCLTETRREVRFSASALFVAGRADEDAGEYPYSNGCVDLSEFMRESVVFALPAAIYCDGCAKDKSI